jgi:hypothetical protein
MRVLRHLGHCDSVGKLAPSLAQRKTVTLVKRRLALQIRQGKVGLPVAAIRRSQQGKERLVLIDGQKLSVAERPALWRKIEAKDSDF